MERKEETEVFRRTLLRAIAFRAKQSVHQGYQSAAQFGAATLLLWHFGSEKAVEEAGIVRQLEFLWREVDQPRDARERFATAWLELHAAKLGLKGLDFPTDNLDSIVAELAFIAMTNRAMVGLDPAIG